MQPHGAWRMRLRLGAVALGLATLLYLVGLALAPGHFATLDPTIAARQYVTRSFFLSHLCFISGDLLLGCGAFALYATLSARRSEGWACSALVLTQVAIAVLLLFHSLGAFALPAAGTVYLQGHTDALELTRILSSPLLVLIPLGFLLLTVGAILFCCAVWRSGTLSRVAVLAYTLGCALFFTVPQMPQVGHILNGVVISSGGIGLAVGIWRHASRAKPEMAARVSAVKTIHVARG